MHFSASISSALTEFVLSTLEKAGVIIALEAGFDAVDFVNEAVVTLT